jgi:ABC-type nitrate/sulfonate/bicarbonate transport system substrate-binding protein
LPNQKIRLGFVPLNDCAPIVFAHELGLFSKYGLQVELSREPGWATVRDKVAYGQLDAAHALAGMVFAATLGLGSIVQPCLTGLVLNLHGNAITVSSRLWKLAAESSFHDVLRNERSEQHRPTFGIVSPVSSHHFILRKWLEEHAVSPRHDVRIVVVPPPQMVANLEAGHLDGFCVGEPWNSVAILRGAGVCAATSAGLFPGHVEKVLMVRQSFAEAHHEEHILLISALIEACEFCHDPANRDQVAKTLSHKRYLNTSVRAIRSGLNGDIGKGTGAEFLIFAGANVNEPGFDKAEWVLRQMIGSGILSDPAKIRKLSIAKCFRPDLYHESARRIASVPTVS